MTQAQTPRGAPELVRILGGCRPVLLYQPKVELAGGAVVGVEALIRAEQPGGGFIGAATVLAAVEAQDAMPQLTDWVIDTALAQRAAWAAQGIALRVAVNASP